MLRSKVYVSASVKTVRRWKKSTSLNFFEKTIFQFFVYLLLGGAKERQSVGKMFPSCPFLAKVQVLKFALNEEKNYLE